MRTLKDRVAKMMGAKKLSYQMSDGWLLVMTRESDGWHMNYFDPSFTIKEWEKDVVYRTIDQVIEAIMHCEIKCMNSYVEYINQLCTDKVAPKIDRGYIKEVIIERLNIVE